MKEYLDLGSDIIDNGNWRGDRTGTGTLSVFGRQVRFDLSKGFPLLTTKKMFTRGIIHELLWFLKGDTNNNSLLEHNVHIWDEWAVQNRRELSVKERYWWFLEHKANGRELDDITLNGAVDEAHTALDKEGVPRYESLKGDGELGPVYGKQWRSWLGKVVSINNAEPVYANDQHIGFNAEVQREVIDQISILIEGLKKKPFSRRHIVSAWNVEDLPDETVSPQENVKNGKMALAPCHCLFQFYVREMSVEQRYRYAMKYCSDNIKNKLRDRHDDLLAVKAWPEHIVQHMLVELNELDVPKYKLDCQLYQRSCDFCLGIPFNIASYALFTMMIAQCVNMVPGEFIHTFGDLHIYSNHIETFKNEQLNRDPLPLPMMWINPEKKDIFSFTIDDFRLDGYVSYDKVDYKISV